MRDSSKDNFRTLNLVWIDHITLSATSRQISMKIAIIGTRGIPDFYRGFEKSAQFLALGLVERGHEVIVYSSHNHSYQKPEWRGIKLVHVNDPEYRMGSVGNFIYDVNCIRDLKHRDCDVVIQFGYSSSIWSWWLAKRALLITNITAVEWKRGRYWGATSRFLQLSEHLAVRYSNVITSHSEEIKDYIKHQYQKPVQVIPQGADIFAGPKKERLQQEQLQAFQYDLYIGTLEPDNHIEQILDGVVLANTGRPFIVVGNHLTKFGLYLKSKFEAYQVRFLGNIYDSFRLNNLRYYSNLYYHGYSSSGTSHLILEAMAASCLISACEHPANVQILGTDSLYFKNAEDVAKQLLSIDQKFSFHHRKVENNIKKLSSIYNWHNASSQYHRHLKSFFPKAVGSDLAIGENYHVISDK